MADPLKHVQEGDPISAAAWNEIVDRERAAREGESTVQRRRGEVSLSQQRIVVFVLNDSGYDCDRFAVLGIDDVFPTPTDNLSGFKDGPVLHGITPAAGSHEGSFVVLLEPAEDGKIAQACVAGVCVAALSVTDTTHTHAEIANGDRTKLQSGSTGSAQILWKQSGTGTVWGIIRIGIESTPRYQNPCRYNINQLRRESDNNLYYTILGDDPGTWNLYAAEGDETAGYLTRLSPSAYGDPCLRLEAAGLWRFVLRQIIAPVSQSADSSEYSTAQTTTVDSHYHEYDKFVKPTLWEIVSNIQVQEGGTGDYAGIGSAAVTVERWLDNTLILHRADAVVLLENLDEDTNVRIKTYRNGYNIMTTGTFYVSGSIICEWIGPQTD